MNVTSSAVVGHRAEADAAPLPHPDSYRPLAPAAAAAAAAAALGCPSAAPPRSAPIAIGARAGGPRGAAADGGTWRSASAPARDPLAATLRALRAASPPRRCSLQR